jgi:mannose-6-phosphate isomerase-like protein (cupin superfamily)
MSPILHRDDVAAAREATGAAARIFTALDPAAASLITVAEVTLPPGGGTNAHLHKLTEEVYYVLGGIGAMRLDDDVRDVGPGDCVVIPRGVLHEIRNERDEDVVFVAACAPAVDPADFYDADGAPIGLHLSD